MGSGHIRKRSTKAGTSWQIIIDRGVDNNGKRIRDYITVNGAKKEAQRVLTEKLNELNRGTYSVPSGVTVEQHLLDWMETYAKPNLSPSTVRGYSVNLRLHVIPYIGAISVQKLMPVHVQDMINNLQVKGLSPRSIKYAFATLREALQYAMKMQLIQKNPADFATLPKQVKYKGKAYDEDECIAMLQAAKGTEMEVPLNIALGLGLRRGELLALKWSDFDLQKGEVNITRNLIFENGQYIFRQTKTESSNRTLKLPTELVALLKQHKRRQMEDMLFMGTEYRSDDLVCCKSDGSAYNPGSMSHMFNRFLKAHGLREIRLHDLRHSNASLMLKYNVPAKVASQRLGHSSIGITLDLYSHVLGEMDTEVANKIDQGIFKKLG